VTMIKEPIIVDGSCSQEAVKEDSELCACCCVATAKIGNWGPQGLMTCVCGTVGEPWCHVSCQPSTSFYLVPGTVVRNTSIDSSDDEYNED
jgi:hypothetical protein